MNDTNRVGHKPKDLGLLLVSLQSTRSTGAGTNDGGISGEPLHIWIIGKVLVQPLKDIFIAPLCKSFVDVVPIAVQWQSQCGYLFGTGGAVAPNGYVNEFNLWVTIKKCNLSH